jgi:predicted GNAT family acetyltransferase
VNIDHSTRRCRFEFQEKDVEAYLYYERLGDVLDIRATFVPQEFRGRGIGRKLAQAAMDYAREQSLTVRPTCPFVRRLIEADEIS